MWGIIPAAGKGSRIQPLAFSKELLPVGSRRDHGNEKPVAVAEHLLDRMVAAGVDCKKVTFITPKGFAELDRRKFILDRRTRLIVLSPFLHGGFGHLVANTVPFLVLGATGLFILQGPLTTFLNARKTAAIRAGTPSMACATGPTAGCRPCSRGC